MSPTAPSTSAAGSTDVSAGTPSTPVDQRLCLALYRAAHAMDATYRVLLEDVGLTYPQYTLLSVLQQDGPATVTALARRLGLSSNTASPLLKRMELAGWISRRRSTADERTVVVDLTPAGARLGAEVAAVPLRVSGATGMSEADQGRLVAELGRLTAALGHA